MAYSNDKVNDRKAAPTVLALDTSASRSSMVVLRGREILSACKAESEEHRSDMILRDLDLLLRSAGVGISEIDLFGVCVGPGSFTGLRIGLASVKGLALASRKPVLGVTSLEAVAASASSNGRLLSMIKAYKGEIYAQLFSVAEGGAPVAESDPVVTTSEEAVEKVAGFEDMVFAGDAAIDSIEIIRKVGGSRFAGLASGCAQERGWIAVELLAPLAESVGSIAMEKFRRGESEAPESLRACYVRPSEAEIKLAQGLLGSKIRRSAGRE